MHRRRFRSSFLGGLGALGAAVVYPAWGRAADAYTLRLSCVDGPPNSTYQAGVHFAEAVQRRSNGRLKVEIYPNGQLEKEQASIQALTTGVLDLALQPSAELVSLFPRYQVFDLPFMFKDFTSAYRVLDGPIGDEFFGDLGSKGIIGLAWGSNGFKELETTNKQVTAPEDMRGLRVRIQGSAVYAATYQALGAIPVAIDLSETFTALSQRIIDAVEVSLLSTWANKYYTLTKHVAMTNHAFAVIVLAGSKQKIEALPADLQTVLKQEGKALPPFWRSVLAQKTTEAVQFLKNNGVAFTDVQYAAFRKAVEPVYATYRPKLGGDLVDRVGRAANPGT
jgi:TRAP-type transport system periplasmic protein